MTLQQIDSVCDEFESALRRGDTLIIEDFLPKVEEPERSALIKELLEIEVQYVAERSASESAVLNMQESLKKRFSEHQDFIRSLFRQINKLQKIGDYEILDELGRGGMGVVYKAKHKLLHQTVAIKVLSQNLLDDSQAVGRFKREIQLIGGLTHPNVVRALNAGEVEGMHYLAMEFVEGLSLQKLVESVQKTPGNLPIIPLGAACEAIRQAALGLQNVHELKLVHRDIKPANLMIDYRATVKILDLGLGKFAEERRDDYHSSLTMAGMVIGTVDYISPEQCENSKEADIRSDVYSLGCCLYFLLMGKPVYSGSRYDTIRKKLMAHIIGDVPSLRQEIPDLPKGIEAILQKAVAKDPAERFQTPIELVEALTPFASFDELWTLMGEVIPSDVPGTRSDSRYINSPYGSFHSLKQPVPPSAKRWKWMTLFISLNLLIFGLAIGAAVYYARPSEKAIQTAQLVSMRVTAKQAEEQGDRFWKAWKMAEAQAEFMKAMKIRAEEFLQTREGHARVLLAQNRHGVAMTHWYLGDSQRARQDMQSMFNTIEDSVRQGVPVDPQLLFFQMFALERQSDFVLFGGAASNRNRERFAGAITRYDEAAKISTDDLQRKKIRWKQAILYSLNGEQERAESLLEQNPLPDSLAGDDRSYFRRVRQLAEAVIFYHQQKGGADRDQKLRAFQRQFSLPSGAAQETAVPPEILELHLFCSELLIADSIKNENGRALSDDFLPTSLVVLSFLRQYPEATPFMRRFCEFLIHSAVLLHDQSEQTRDKCQHIDNIVRLLDRMRGSASGDSATVIYFFLPVNETDQSFVIFYPQDGRNRVLYPLSLTRVMAKGKHDEAIEPLPPALLELAKKEPTVRISWNDAAAWSRADEALSEKDYPYGDVLPLRSDDAQKPE
ncbi:MAG: protein kinase [Planctomycetaceae bacterium]|jgi:serine/threonine protein kinase|nr:protein kinase [Planctomycetaceae bacterium]